MLDRDLAELYDVPVKRLNEQVKRNIKRFPKSFRFQLSNKDKNELVANCDRFKTLKHSTINPYAFTEQGVAMLSAVLRSDKAVEVSIKIMSAFVEMRKFLIQNTNIISRIHHLEYQQIQDKIETNEKIDLVFNALQPKLMPPKQGIFFDGQFFDAYTLVSDIIRSAKRDIVLIDNYIDDKTLQLFTKRNKDVSTFFYSKKITKTLKQDIETFNRQYELITVKKLKSSHDRFLIIDRKKVYHFGASLKDIGKDWFAFSLLNIDANDILEKL